jgi:hypothetical protein
VTYRDDSLAPHRQRDTSPAVSAFPILSLTASATELMKETPYNLIVTASRNSLLPKWSIVITGHQPSVSFILSYLERENSSGNQVCTDISLEGSLTGRNEGSKSGVGSFRYASELVVSIIETALGFEPSGSCAYYVPSAESAATIRYWRRTHAFAGI